MAEIRLRGVTKRFGGVTAVHDVSLEIREGELLSLLGPSGCGKTTTLRLIAGLIEPDTGEIWIGKKRVDNVPAHLRGIGLVFQHGALFPHRTVLENVAFGLKMRRVPRSEREERAREALKMVRLEGFERRYPRELSGGQQQRVALARALVLRPSVLLLDEPFSALDLRLRLELRREVRELQRSLGITTVAVTHDQGEALGMSDRVAILNHGSIEQVGTPREIYARPASPFVAGFIGETNVLPGVVVERQGSSVTVRAAGGLEVRTRIDHVNTRDRVLMVVRPDAMSLELSRNGDRGGASTVSGEVYLESFLGEVTRYFVRIGGAGSTIFVDVPSRARGEPIRVGDRVQVAVDEDAVLCFAAPDVERRSCDGRPAHRWASLRGDVGSSGEGGEQGWTRGRRRTTGSWLAAAITGPR
jgi:spermidine/putrescine ABC transporter ATP-binding subunit